VRALHAAGDRADDQGLPAIAQRLVVLYAHGLRNHRYEPVIELFGWVAGELPDSYGLLYIQDDEAEGHHDDFRVWRLARGSFEELPDPFLSPYIPTVEPPEGSAPGA
jgi:hypothetical protein